MSGDDPPAYSEYPEYDALQDALERLYDAICPERITVALQSRHLLSNYQAESIHSKATTCEKNYELLSAVQFRRNPAEVLQLCQVLLEKQSHCGNILKEALQARGVDTSSLTVATLEPSAVSHVSAKYYPRIDELDVALGDLVQKMKDGTKNSQNLKTYCSRFLTTLSFIHSHYTKDALDRLATPDCQNEEAIDVILRFVDPLDCCLLYKIVSALDDENLMVAWDDYCQRYRQACRITLEQCRKVAIRPHRSPPSGITLGMQTKISPSDITIQKILQLKDFLISKVGLEEIDFNGFACSPVALFFTISRERLPFLIRLLSGHQKSLLDFSITTVFVPGEFFYDVAKDQEYPCPKDENVQESVGTPEQALSFAGVESRFSAAVERIAHAQMAVQKKEELVHMERKEVEKERLQNQVQSLVCDNLKLQDENRLLEKQLLQRLDALQEMIGRGAETQPQGEREVPEKDLPVVGVEVTSDVELELSEPPSKKSKLQELEPEKKEDIRSSLEETKAVLADYGIEVMTWSDVPKAIKTLADRWDVKPVSTDLQDPPTMTQLALLSDKYLSEDAWVSIALHLGVSFDLCEEIREDNYRESDRTTLLFLIMARKWLTRVKGTGELPRTKDTMLKAFKTRYPHLEAPARKLLLETA